MFHYKSRRQLAAENAALREQLARYAAPMQQELARREEALRRQWEALFAYNGRERYADGRDGE